jgi:hypothetical protein
MAHSGYSLRVGGLGCFVGRRRCFGWGVVCVLSLLVVRFPGGGGVSWFGFVLVWVVLLGGKCVGCRWFDLGGLW